jgi:hypothetical protein
MEFNLEGALQEGYSYSDIAAELAKRNQFNLQGAQKEGYSDEDIVQHLISRTNQIQKPVNQTKPQDNYAKGLTDIRGIPEDMPPENVLQFRQQQQAERNAYNTAKAQEGIGSKLVGAVEAPISVASKILGGLSGMAGKAVRGETTVNDLGFEKGTQYGYNPRTIAGQEIVEDIPEVIQQSGIEGLPMFGELEALGSLRFLKGARNIPSTFRPREIPVVGQVIQGAESVAAPIAKGVSKAAEVVTSPISKAIEKTSERFGQSTKLKQYNDVLDNYELESADAVVKGIPAQDIKPYVLQKLGIDDATLNKASSTLNKPILIPKTIEEAQTLTQIKRLSEYKDPSLFSKLLEPIQSRLKTIAEPIANRLGRYEFNINNRTQQYLNEVTPFLSTIVKFDTPIANKLSLDLFNGNFNGVRTTLKTVAPESIESFNKVEDALKSLHQELKDSGYKNLGYESNYFPRRVNDLEGFYKEIGVKQKGQIESLLVNKANTLKVARQDLTDEQIADTLNKYLRGYGQKSASSKPYFTKSRAVSQVDERILPYYASPVESLENYIRSSINNIEKNKFFGKNAVIENGKTLNLDSSIGSLIAKDLDTLGGSGDEVTALLRARFNMGERAPSKIVKTAKDIIYAATIANPKSAITQLGDVGTSNFINGNINSIKSLLGSKTVTIKDLGLDTISAELSTAKGTSKLLNQLFTISGFRAIDKLGKETFINAALNNARALSKNQKGLAKLRGKYGNVLGDEFDSFAKDLQQGKITDNVKYYLFSELAEVQPITLSQLPRQYLESPNGRLLYALKSFTIKQLDVMKKNIYDVYKAGNKKQAAQNAVAYLTLVGGANTTVDQFKKLIEGKNISLEDIPDEFAFNVLKLFGGSKFLYDKYLAQGKIGEAAVRTVAPPLDIISAPVEDAVGFLSDNPNYKYKTPSKLPLVGWAINNFFGGGLERYEKEQFKKQYGSQ